MAIEDVVYIDYAEAALAHIELMRFFGEPLFGVFDRALVESALSRPQQAAAYEDADLIRQAATLCFGLIKNHPWVGGNKRTATALVIRFLVKNGARLKSSTKENVELVLAVESDRWRVDEIDAWLREHVVRSI